ncbi:glutamate receptor ionotropic, kainate glr-3-like [Parasteatoda tepidariorum]|uniref:glutamate receptor ionotropic, kainate glr-3-like n=1 Tax=Parasteatoda tepidariorum TaxID=114398 RepID=UPI001C71E9A8|nr:glutamate [NMDA] receptor subunit 1-like [Parasteatoda tepidariorum]
MSTVKQIISYPSSLPKFKTCIHELIDVYIIKEIKPDARPVLSGYEGELLHLIADGLHISLEYYVDEIGWPTTLPENASLLDGCLGMVTRGEVDFTVSSMNQNHELSKYADTSFPYLYLTVRFMTKLPDYVEKHFVLMEPFPPSMWISVFLTLLLISLAFYLIQGRRLTYPVQFFKRFSEVVSQSIRDGTNSIPERILRGFWILGAYFLTLFYIAVILNFMIVPRRQPPIDNNEILLAAVKRGGYKVGTPLEIKQILFYMETSTNPTVRELARIVVRNGWELSVTKDTFVEHLKNNFALATTELGLQLYNQRGFPVSISKDVLFKCNLAAFMSKNFPLKRKFNEVVLRIFETGLYSKTLDHYVFQLHLKDDACQCEEARIKTLTLADMEGAFLLFIYSTLVSTGVLLIEILVSKLEWERKHKQTKLDL